ncbi:hypothetical protein ACXHPF_16905, partial [Vibrio cincinnatiensis]
MATLLLSGTQLEPQTPKAPLNKAFLLAVGCAYLVAMHFFMPNPGGSGLALSFLITTNFKLTKESIMAILFTKEEAMKDLPF